MSATATLDSTLRALYSYADRGWPVLPLHAAPGGVCTCGGLPGCKPGKHPNGALVPHGENDATTDRKTIWHWLTTATTPLNWGLELERSRLLAIDADSPEAVSEAASNGLPPTMIRHSRSPAYVYTRPKDCPAYRAIQKGTSGKIDVLTKGNFVILGTHAEGMDVYLTDDDPEPATDWAVQIVRDAYERSPGERTITPPDPNEPPVRLGGDDLRLWRGEVVVDKADGVIRPRAEASAVDRSRTLYRIGVILAGRYATRSTIAEAVAERDETLGYLKYADRRDDGESDYRAIADKAVTQYELVIPPSKNGTAAATVEDGAFRPSLFAGEPDLAEITRQTWEAILATNLPPTLFRRGGIPCRIGEGDDGEPVIQDLTPERMRIELAERCEWFKLEQRRAGGGLSLVKSPARPPVDVVAAVLATGTVPLPVLWRVVEAPVFGRDGTLSIAPGYHAAARAVYVPPRGLVIPTVSDAPTDSDLARAKNLILAELLGEFPFETDADRANAVGLGLLPFARELIAGTAPLHEIESTSPGTGKGLLVAALLRPSLGSHVGTIAATDNDDELRKSITSRLKEGHGAIWLDNANHAVTSPVLASALTAPVWSDRLLGKNETINLPVRCVWTLTSNNPSFSSENMRRCVPIRLVADQDRPWLRTGFKKSDLLGWVDAHRGELVWAYLTLIQHWVRQGRQSGAATLGSYEQWARVIGGILDAADIPSFLANRLAFYESADTEGELLRALVAAWWERFQNAPVRAADLFGIWNELEGLDGDTEKASGQDKPRRSDRAERTAFGQLLGKQRDRVIGECRVLRVGRRGNSTAWRLQRAQPRGTGAEMGTSGTLGTFSQPLTDEYPKPVGGVNRSPRSLRSPPVDADADGANEPDADSEVF